MSPELIPNFIIFFLLKLTFKNYELSVKTLKISNQNMNGISKSKKSFDKLKRIISFVNQICSRKFGC